MAIVKSYFAIGALILATGCSTGGGKPLTGVTAGLADASATDAATDTSSPLPPLTGSAHLSGSLNQINLDEVRFAAALPQRYVITLSSWSAMCSELVADGAFIEIYFIGGIPPVGTYLVGGSDSKLWSVNFGRYDATCSTNTERTVLGGTLVLTESSERGVVGTVDFATSTGHQFVKGTFTAPACAGLGDFDCRPAAPSDAGVRDAGPDAADDSVPFDSSQCSGDQNVLYVGPHGTTPGGAIQATNWSALTNAAGDGVRVKADTRTGYSIVGLVGPTQGVALTPGTYRTGSVDGGGATFTLLVDGIYNDCDEHSARFRIDTFRYTSSSQGVSVHELTSAFVVSCGPASPPVQGCVHFQDNSVLDAGDEAGDASSD